ncbi:MAG: TIGR03663 family protein [Anaerolineales bacterium]|nr:TIGR03663 family protein [Anaerolineales bacterium]
MEFGKEKETWLDQPVFTKVKLNAELILMAIILILAIVSRFYGLGWRVMSHDENTHVYYSWRFYQGQGLSHDPLMHGPLQFHLIALSYFVFGDSDFTARLPHALFSIAAVAFMWYFRRYLGRVGALVGAALMLISPYMLYYGRYARNEVFSQLFGLVTIWAILRFLETGQPRYMYALTAATVLHFTAKETSYIYAAQALLFLAGYFIYRISKLPWRFDKQRRIFIVALIVALLMLGGTGVSMLAGRTSATLDVPQTVEPSIPGQELSHLPVQAVPELTLILLILSGIALVTAGVVLIWGYTWKRLRQDRSFSLLILLGTLVLPHLSAFPVRWLGWIIPTNASQVMALSMTDILHIAVVVIPLVGLSIIVGVLWNPRQWLINTAIFYALFTVFYTSVFTNGAGFFTGLVGSLGYWLEQQGVNRGSQPWYYYGLVQVPVYEYLPALGTLLAFGIALARSLAAGFKGPEQPIDAEPTDSPIGEIPDIPSHPEASLLEGYYPDEKEEYFLPESAFLQDNPPVGLEKIREEDHLPEPAPVLALLGFWGVTSLAAYSIAGEKMPWLTVHIALPFILSAAWAFGLLIESIDWRNFLARRGWLVLALTPVALFSALAMVGSLLGSTPPFQGKELSQLQATSTFMTSLLTAVLSGAALLYLAAKWKFSQLLRLMTLYLVAILAFFTARTAIQSSFINYDNANELLVYAHSAGGVKVAMEQIEEISIRTTNGTALQVAYDNETSYPYWWYLRNYTQVRYYGTDPSRSLREVPVILVGDANYGKIEAVVGNLYDKFDYIRLWWPNQDYWNLTWQRVADAFKDPEMREALFQIWLNRDYTKYGQVLDRDMSLQNWSPAARMRLYIRKDIVTQLWNYGAAPSAQVLESDPFDDKQLSLMADRVFGAPGAQPGQFQRPRDLAVAPDGTLYIADTENHRIQHVTMDGTVLQVWGEFGDVAAGEAAAGTFNQPWGIAIGSDGSVYVADTWNHRIQKFSQTGEFLKLWGYFGQAEQPAAFWGPRDVAVDSAGRVYVTDTGNKRVVIFDSEGNYIDQFGSVGFEAGEFDEPVGLAVDGSGQIYVADTWNQRIQVISAGEDGVYRQIKSWDVTAWFGQSLDNKPYLVVDGRGNVFITDPEGYRVLWFSDVGVPVYFWGDYGTELDKFGMPGSIAVDPQGGVWVTDVNNGRIMHFTLPLP